MFRNSTPLLGAFFALLPASVLACPTGLGAGIVYAADDGSTTTVTPTDRPDTLRERVQLPEGDGYEIDALYGLFEVTSANFDATGVQEDSRENAVYAAPPTLPEPGAILAGIMADVAGPTGRFDRRLDLQAGPLTDVSLGGCTYQGYEIEMRVFQPEGPMVHHFIRVPALGVAFYTGFQDQDGSERYQITSVTPLSAPAPSK